MSEEQVKQLENICDKYNGEFKNSDQGELDRIIYQLYDLDDSDITVIEEFKIRSRRKR